MSRRQRYSRPTPLPVQEKEEEEEEPYTLPATVYSPEFDEVEEQQIRLDSPTNVSGLFDGDSDTSDTSSAASSRAESLVDNERVVFVGRQKRRESLKRLSDERDRRAARNSRDGRDGIKTPSTPATPPMSPYAPSTSFHPSSTSKRNSSSSSSSSSRDSRRSRLPVKHNYSNLSVQSSGGGKANAILGIGIGHPPVASSRVSTPIIKDPIIDNWDVSDNETPAKPISLKPWGPLSVGAKKTPSIGSIRSLDRSIPARSSSSSSGRFVKPKVENPQPKHVVRARFSEMRGYDDDGMKRKGSPIDSGVAFKLVHHPTHSQSSADILSVPKPRRAQTMGQMKSNESNASSRSSSTSSIRLPKRSPSAPIGPRTSAQSFELTELPVVFSALPLEGTDAYNIVPTEFIVPESRSPSPPVVQTMHPAWNKAYDATSTSNNATRKAELNAMAAMMDPSSSQATSFRTKYPMESVSPVNLEIPNLHHANMRPDSRWSDYSEAESIKEGWRNAVLNHFHLPSVINVRRKLDLRVPVAAAKEGIRKMGTKEIHEIKEEEPFAGNRRSAEAGTLNPNNTNRGSTSSGSSSNGNGIFRVGSRVATGRSGSIVTLARSKSVLRPESARIEKASISAPQPQGTPTPSSSRPVSTAARPVSTATQRGSMRGRPDSSPLASSTTATMTPTATTMLDVGGLGSGDEVTSPGARRFKDVFEKYMVKDPRKKAVDERRRNELKKKITVIGNGPGGLI